MGFDRQLSAAFPSAGSGLTTRSIPALAAALLGAPLLAFVALATAKYPGTIERCLLFQFSFLLMAALAIPRPRSYAFGYFSVLLALGFWLKFNAHMFFQYDFVEPIGRFSGSAAEWDRALLWSSAAAWGISIPRAGQLCLGFLRRRPEIVASVAPGWYAAYRTWLWRSTLVIVVALNAWNVSAAIYQIGVNPRVQLPRVTAISAAWLINLGLALWLAALVHWEHRLQPSSLGVVLRAPLIEGFLCTVSALSRSLFLLHTIPYAVVLLGRRIRLKRWAALAVLFCSTFALSIVLVQLSRIALFSRDLRTVADTNAAAPGTTSEAAGAGALTNPVVLQSNVRQLLFLASDRWVGLEGVLAVSSHSPLGASLLLQGITESPRRGNQAIYQQLAGSPYRSSPTFTFLTIAGPVGILSYSGSALVVVLGMSLLTIVLLGTEGAIWRSTGNPFLTSVAGLAMANVVQQLNFPYLALVFLVELWVTVAGIALISGKRVCVAAHDEASGLNVHQNLQPRGERLSQLQLAGGGP